MLTFKIDDLPRSRMIIFHRVFNEKMLQFPLSKNAKSTVSNVSTAWESIFMGLEFSVSYVLKFLRRAVERKNDLISLSKIDNF